MEIALHWLIKRHESLRTAFAEADGVVAQVVLPVSTAAVGLPRRAMAPPPGDVAALAAAARAEVERPFDVAGGGPLFRAVLVDSDVGTSALVMTTHHAVSDGWSWGVMWRELGGWYSALAGGTPVPHVPRLPVSYADFSAWQRARMADGALRLQLDYWRVTLAGAPPLLELPTDKPRPALASGAGGNVPIAVAPAIVAGLRELAASSDTSLFAALLAAFQVLLARYARADDVVVGTPVAGRDRPELEGLVGYFVNPVALRTDLSGSPSFRELLCRARTTVTGALSNADAPFLSVVEAVGAARGTGASPIFQTMIVLQDKAFNADIDFGVTVAPSIQVREWGWLGGG